MHEETNAPLDGVDNGVRAGQAVYTPLTLKLYDWVVLGLSNHVIWRCPTRELRALYDRNVGESHLDIGVGTGYFLDKAKWPVPSPRITLLDLNPHSLDAAAKRIARYSPDSRVADILQPLPGRAKHDSVGLCYLLHCLPGEMSEKAAIVFDNAASALKPNGRVFGATILQGDAPRSRTAQMLMNFYNRKGVFSNVADTRQALESALTARFRDVDIRLSGTVALFEARKA